MGRENPICDQKQSQNFIGAFGAETPQITRGKNPGGNPANRVDFMSKISPNQHFRKISTSFGSVFDIVFLYIILVNRFAIPVAFFVRTLYSARSIECAGFWKSVLLLERAWLEGA